MMIFFTTGAGFIGSNFIVNDLARNIDKFIDAGNPYNLNSPD